jgi:hypothetical protein
MSMNLTCEPLSLEQGNMPSLAFGNGKDAQHATGLAMHSRDSLIGPSAEHASTSVSDEHVAASRLGTRTGSCIVPTRAKFVPRVRAMAEPTAAGLARFLASLWQFASVHSKGCAVWDFSAFLLIGESNSVAASFPG